MDAMKRHQRRRDEARKAWIEARGKAGVLWEIVSETGTHLEREEASRLLADAESKLAELLRLSDRTIDAELRGEAKA